MIFPAIKPVWHLAVAVTLIVALSAILGGLVGSAAALLAGAIYAFRG